MNCLQFPILRMNVSGSDCESAHGIVCFVIENIVLSSNWKNKNTIERRSLPVMYRFIPNERHYLSHICKTTHTLKSFIQFFSQKYPLSKLFDIVKH